MTDIGALIHDLKNNSNVEYWGSLLDEFDQRLAELHKKIDGEKFDLIYIDGNHHADNVLKDAINSFKTLNKGGFIIFDDFLWDYYNNINLNPIGGIKKFLSENFFKIKIVSIGYQLVIQKK